MAMCTARELHVSKVASFLKENEKQVSKEGLIQLQGKAGGVLERRNWIRRDWCYQLCCGMCFDLGKLLLGNSTEPPAHLLTGGENGERRERVIKGRPCSKGSQNPVSSHQPAPLPDSMEKEKGQHLLEHLRDRVWSVPLAYGFSLPDSHLGCITTENRIM